MFLPAWASRDAVGSSARRMGDFRPRPGHCNSLLFPGTEFVGLLTELVSKPNRTSRSFAIFPSARQLCITKFKAMRDIVNRGKRVKKSKGLENKLIFF